MPSRLTDEQLAETRSLYDAAKAARGKLIASITERDYEDALRRALSDDGKSRRDGLKDLLHLIGLKGWPSGDRWRGNLIQLLITIGPPLISRPGPKRRAVIVDRNAHALLYDDALAERDQARRLRIVATLIEMGVPVGADDPVRTAKRIIGARRESLVCAKFRIGARTLEDLREERKHRTNSTGD